MSLHRPRRASFAALLLPSLLALSPAVAPARAVARAQTSTSGSTTESRLFTKRDLATGGIFLGASALLSLWDDDIYRALRDSSIQGNTLLSGAVGKASYLQETYLTAGGIVLWGAGRLAKNRTLADIGIHTAEAVFMASIASQAIRGPLGRARPEGHDNDGDGRGDVHGKYEFKPFHGFGDFDYRAFPSIHSASGFAAATVIHREVAERWPQHKGWVGPVAYAIAATPGLSRLYLGKHWASDVLMGGFMGVMAGQKIVTYNHRRPNNRVNRLFLGRSNVDARTSMLNVGITRQF
jgi:membrane-associated phospholipid phosphatase